MGSKALVGSSLPKFSQNSQKMVQKYIIPLNFFFFFCENFGKNDNHEIDNHHKKCKKLHDRKLLKSKKIFQQLSYHNHGVLIHHLLPGRQGFFNQ